MSTSKVFMLVGNILATIFYTICIFLFSYFLIEPFDFSTLSSNSNVNKEVFSSNARLILISLIAFYFLSLLFIWFLFTKFENNRTWSSVYLVYAIIALIPSYLFSGAIWLTGSIIELTKNRKASTRNPKPFILFANLIGTGFFLNNIFDRLGRLNSTPSNTETISSETVQNALTYNYRATGILTVICAILCILLVWIAFVKFEKSQAWTIVLLTIAMISILSVGFIPNILWLMACISQLTKFPISVKTTKIGA
ncbi:MAG: hypothetical protein LBM95_03660 [Lactobacillales bacterium]|nr:hypothetical protein [Lactobacillales bacterium]